MGLLGLSRRTKFVLCIIILFIVSMIRVAIVCDKPVSGSIKINNPDDTQYDNSELEYNLKVATLSDFVYYDDVKVLGNVIFNESRGLSTLEKSCVAWCILNRCDRYDASIEAIVASPNQFAYFPDRELSDNEKIELAECESLAKDIILRWLCEKEGIENVGRTLPADYYYFHGDGEHNYFKQQWHTTDYWDYSLPSPYEI